MHSIEVCTKSNSRKSWSGSPSSDIVTDLTESIILQQWKKRVNYNCTRTGHKCWLVWHVNDSIFPDDIDFRNIEVDNDTDDEDFIFKSKNGHPLNHKESNNLNSNESF